MRLLIVRHGKAVDPHEAGTDSARWLTPEGRGVMRAQGVRLQEMGLRPTRIYTSPLVRAVQTAEILAHTTGYDGAPAVRPALSPDAGSTAQAVAGFDTLDPHEVVMMVGHMPKVRVIAGHVLGGVASPDFRTGSICLIDWDDPAAAGAAGVFRFLLEGSGRLLERLVDLHA